MFRFCIAFFIAKCVCVSSFKIPNNEVANFVESLVADDEKGITFIERKLTLDGNIMSPATIGIGIDFFLTTRPWWWVVKEPYKWNSVNHTKEYDLVLKRFGKEWDPILHQLVRSQYPMNCDGMPLKLRRCGGFDSFGNNFWNFVAAKNSHPSILVAPLVTGTGVSFLDDKSCPHIKNRFECAFLPVTNCSLPDKVFDESADHYSNAGKNGQGLQRDKFNELMRKFPMGSLFTRPPVVLSEVYAGLIKPPVRKMDAKTDPYGLMYGYGLLYRPNHHFRSLVSRIIYDWNAKLPVPFPENGDCVSVIIRRQDRIVANVSMYAWCEAHQIYPNGSCLNDQNGKIEVHGNCVHYLDYGCGSGIPFGEMTLEKALKAVQLVSKSKNVLVRCDESRWLEEQVRTTPTNLNIFTFTPTDETNHRRSTTGGANYLAAIHLSRLCPALVGHRESAVTVFTQNIMCVRHANSTGTCPTLYDFGQG